MAVFDVSPTVIAQAGGLIQGSTDITPDMITEQMCIRDRCKAIYKDNAETILGNIDSVIFLGGRESYTIKEISENWLGKATISIHTEGRSLGQSESYNQNTQRLGRELMTPDELATMPGDKCILQLRGLQMCIRDRFAYDYFLFGKL